MQMHSGGAIRFSGKRTDSQIKIPPLGGILVETTSCCGTWPLCNRPLASGTGKEAGQGCWGGMGKDSARFADKGMSQSRLGSLRLVPSRSMI